jgi:hypothetical protein
MAPEEIIDQQTLLMEVKEKEGLRTRIIKKAAGTGASTEMIQRVLKTRGVDEGSLNALRGRAKDLAPKAPKQRRTFKDVSGRQRYEGGELVFPGEKERPAYTQKTALKRLSDIEIAKNKLRTGDKFDQSLMLAFKDNPEITAMLGGERSEEGIKNIEAALDREAAYVRTFAPGTAATVTPPPAGDGTQGQATLGGLNAADYPDQIIDSDRGTSYKSVNGVWVPQ